MKARKLVSISLLIFAFLSLAGAACPQTAPLEPAQMPARTSFYFLWRGLPSAEARKSSALFSLWDDPDFAPMRSGIIESFANHAGKDEAKKQMARQSFDDFATLLENPFVFGFLGKPDSVVKSSGAKWQGIFFVYDRSGKEALLTKTVLAMRAQGQETPQISQVTIADVPALKIERKTGASYWVETGKYAVSANDPAVLEEILPVLLHKSAPPATLTASAEFQEAQPLLGSGLFEFFLRIPRIKEFPADNSVKGFKIAPLLDALKLDSVHSVAGHATLEGGRTRLQGAVLGDPSPSTLFDIWSQAKSAPASLSFVSPDTVSYNSGQFNLLALYEIAKRAMRMYMPPSPQGGPDLIESIAQSRLGMSIPDALGLFTGEFASIQTSPSLDAAKQSYVLKITKKPETLKLLRTILSDRVESEKTENDVTFLKISLSGSQTASGTAQWNFYHVAVTPDMLLASSRSETLRQLLAERRTSVPGNEYSTLPKFQSARSQFPAELSSISFLDFQRLDWQAVKDKWLTDAKSAARKKKTVAQGGEAAKQQPEGVAIPNWLSSANPQVLSHHLHFMAGASWKDAKGLHFDQWIE
ncbi:MAG TPA: hypothetical protein VK525_03160 [Candidatus Saccharimonadales bacterium]|nr:hypothetical protein [Candidatus Saccharimonadales bacterium]